MEPAMFSPAALFGAEDDKTADVTSGFGDSLEFVERRHEFPGMVLLIREFAFHVVNANLLWPGTISFADWLVVHQHLVKGKKVLELGSGTGALAIFLKKAFSIDISTSDYDDETIEENIEYNCKSNGITKLPHIRHTWGDLFPVTQDSFDLILASDILLYVKQYPNLIKTLMMLLKEPIKEEGSVLSPQSGIILDEGENSIKHSNAAVRDVVLARADVKLPKPCFLMSWRRRLPKEDEAAFFNGCKDEGFTVLHLGCRVYCIFRCSSRTR